MASELVEQKITTQEDENKKVQQAEEVSEEESDYSDESELSQESSSSSDEDAKQEVQAVPSMWNRVNSWFISHREVTVAILVGISAIGVALGYRSLSASH